MADLGRQCCGICAGYDDGHLAIDEISRKRRQSIRLIFRPTVLDGYILAFDIVGFLQPAMETGDLTVQLRCRTDVEKTDHRHRRLLRARRKRPRCRRTAEQRDELAARK